MLEWLTLSCFQVFDCDRNMFICSNCLTIYSSDDFQGIGDPGFYPQSVTAATIIKKLNLHQEEMAVFKALAMYSPGEL